MSAEPRAHLYLFAHRALPALGLGHPKGMLGALCGPRCSDFLTAVWNDAGQELQPSERMEFPEVACAVKRREKYLMAVICFPPPMGITEPFFSAFVFGPIEERGDLDRLAARYLILENGVNDFNEPRTVLCEWTDQSHRNYGDGPDALTERFEEAVWKIVHQSQPQR